MKSNRNSITKQESNEEKQNITPIQKILISILILLFIGSVISFLAVPFLSNVIKLSIAQIIWYPSLIVYLVLSIIGLKDNSDSTPQGGIVNFVGGWGIFVVTTTITAVFTIKYYNFDNAIRWIIFALILIITPIFFFSLLNFDLKNNKRTKKEINKGTKNILKYIFLYMLLDVLYMAVFNHFVVLTIITGILAVSVMFYNISKAFLYSSTQFPFLIVIDFILTLCLSIYLIFIIPNESLRNIVLTIVAAVMGGGFTLLGVAWTFKKSAEDRKADLERLENERKDDERKQYRPFVNYNNIQYEESLYAIPVYDFLQESDYVSKKETLDLQTPNIISNCHFSNTEFSSFYIWGLKLDNELIEFRTMSYVKKDEMFGLNFTDNPIYTSKPIETISLIFEDLLENQYELPLEIDCDKKTNRYFIVGNKTSVFLGKI